MVSPNRCVRAALGIFVISLLVPAAAAAGCVDGDCRNGKGRYEWANGASYDGDFKNGAFEGNGTYTFPSGARYAGHSSASAVAVAWAALSS